MWSGYYQSCVDFSECWGIKEDKYSSAKWLYILKKKVNLWSFRRFCSDSQQISMYRLLIEASLVAPAASF